MTTASPTLADITREADVKALVDNFCDKVSQDEMLSPAFKAAARVYWPQHLFTMYDYWNATLLDSVRTKASRPFPKEVGLPTEGPQFQRWLKLFCEAVQENFAGPKAEEAKTKARSITTMLEYTIAPKSALSLG